MTPLTVAIDYRFDRYDTMRIDDVESLFANAKKDARVGDKYKKMVLSDFIKWLELGVTPKQFQKLDLLRFGEIAQCD